MSAPLPGDPWFEDYLDDMESRIESEREMAWAEHGATRQDEADTRAQEATR